MVHLGSRQGVFGKISMRRMKASHSRWTPNKPWRFVTNHTQVLLAIASNPDIRTRDIADAVGITERAAQRIVADLIESGNHYTVNGEVSMRHPAQHNYEIGALLALLKLDKAETPE